MTNPEFLIDTSVAVALTVAGHEFHARTLDEMHGKSLGLAGHAWFETFSVLTRLPPPARRNPTEVVAIMNHNFPHSKFLSAEGHRDLADRITALGIAGGAVYDALVGAVAAEHELTLVSRDRRAIDVYRAVGTNTRLLG